MVYQFNSDMLPDTYFHPGDLKYIVPGNEGRWLDPRRTPIRILEVKPASGFFIVEILDFEDKGARWEVQLESVDASLRKEAPKRAKPTAHCTRRQSHAWTDSLRLQRTYAVVRPQKPPSSRCVQRFGPGWRVSRRSSDPPQRWICPVRPAIRLYGLISSVI